MDLVADRLVQNICGYFKLRFPVKVVYVPLKWCGDHRFLRFPESHHLVRIANDLTGAEKYATIAHELKHAEQEESGKFRYKYVNGVKYVFWENKQFRCTYKLWNLALTPWERSAVRFEARWQEFMPQVEQLSSKVRRIR